MSILQNSYPDNIGIGFPGQVANTTTCDVDSRVAEVPATEDGIPFARACQKTDKDGGCQIGLASSAAFVGISIRERTLRPQDVDGSGNPVYPNGYHVGLLIRGDIFVDVESAVVDGAIVTANEDTGRLSDDVVASDQFQVMGARWMTTQAVADGIAVLRLGPVPATA